MEDRQTPVLYMELLDADPLEYEARSERLLERPGAHRVTWWANAAPHRRDLPRKVPDRSLLGVTEADGTFTAPEAPADASAYRFQRRGRPSQGILTGGSTTGLLIVWISPRTPDDAMRLRDWGDFVHIRHIAAAGIPGFTQISVYEQPDGTDPRYLHFYELEGDDPEAAFSAMTPAVAPRLGGMGSAAYEEWADWRRAGGRLFYCNTFRLLGERRGGGPRPGAGPAAPAAGQ